MLSALSGGFMGARYGQSPARVVALHGWQRSHTDFAAVLDGLDAVAPDLPGFGATSAPASAWGAAGYAEALLPLVDGETVPVVVLGHSFGGRIAVMLASARPDLVTALVLTGAPLVRPPGVPIPRPSLGLRAAKVLNRIGVVSDKRLEDHRRRSGPADYRAATGVMREVFVKVIAEYNDGVYARAMRELRCPVEMVWGADDTAAPLGGAYAAAELASDAKLTVLPGVGHLTPLVAPEQLRTAIERHL